MFVALFGPPGAGKGTQAAFLREEYGITHVATGDIFRKNLREGTELGQLARSYMNNGQLVPDEVVWQLVEDRLSQPDCAGGVLFDGFPRSVRQAELLVDWAERTGNPLHRVAALTVPDEELVGRLSGRRTCRSCQATYHISYNPPPADGTCSNCESGDIYQREDDSEESVRKRIATYHRDTAPVLGFFKARGLVSEVDGTGAIGDITDRLRSALGPARTA